MIQRVLAILLCHLILSISQPSCQSLWSSSTLWYHKPNTTSPCLPCTGKRLSWLLSWAFTFSKSSTWARLAAFDPCCQPRLAACGAIRDGLFGTRGRTLHDSSLALACCSCASCVALLCACARQRSGGSMRGGIVVGGGGWRGGRGGAGGALW